MEEKKFIYLDHAATTAARPEVVEAMLPYFTEKFGNPSSVYTFSQQNKAVITQCRDVIANSLNAKSNEIYFTAGGSESDNWALKATAEAYASKGKHIITTKIEHHAILHTCEYLERRGFEVTYLDVDENGLVHPEEVEKAIRPDTILISVMAANNEIGTVQPLAKIGKIAKEHGVLFHTDAVQAAGHIKINVNELNVDMLSMSAHKFYGPKGIGVLFVKKGVPLSPFVHGGHQEKGYRAGTYNNQSIIGMGKAAELARVNLKREHDELWRLREKLRKGIEERVPNVVINGSNDENKCLPGTLNVSFPSAEGESILLYLDMEGIEVSTGSACASGSLEPSYVLLAAGLDVELAHGSIRFSLGRYNTDEDVDYTLEKLPPIIKKIREMSTRK